MIPMMRDRPACSTSITTTRTRLRMTRRRHVPISPWPAKRANPNATDFGEIGKGVVLAGGDGVRVGAVQAGLHDRAVGVGPVQVAAVGRHPVREVLARDDGLRVGAVQAGLDGSGTAATRHQSAITVHAEWGRAFCQTPPGDPNPRLYAYRR